MSNDTGTSPHAVMIERSFDAPVELIWQMWTVPEHFQAWYGPNGATIPVANIDLRVGGIRLICMQVQSPTGPMRMWFTGEHREIVENERLVYSEAICDENGNITSLTDMGLPEGHPVATEVRVDLESIDGGTRMVMTHTGIPAESPGAAGWTMALDKLAAYIASRPPSKRAAR
jgi:uncharacterized protein YndB with AHSA1/START domain